MVGDRAERFDELLIEQLQLRVPGSDSAEARALAEEVAHRLGALLADAPPRRIGSLELKLDIPSDLARGEAARRIAEAIVRGLGR
jgi:hypothetical protein|nr:hypothetical protein [Kofleriaceae bacterium]